MGRKKNVLMVDSGLLQSSTHDGSDVQEELLLISLCVCHSLQLCWSVCSLKPFKLLCQNMFHSSTLAYTATVA